VADESQCVTGDDSGTAEAAGPWVGGDEWLEWTRIAPLACPPLSAEDSAMFRGLFPPAPRPAGLPVMQSAA
jgi:hypothetical protein